MGHYHAPDLGVYRFPVQQKKQGAEANAQGAKLQKMAAFAQEMNTGSAFRIQKGKQLPQEFPNRAADTGAFLSVHQRMSPNNAKDQHQQAEESQAEYSPLSVFSSHR